MSKARAILAVGTVAGFSVLIAWSARGWGDFLGSGTADGKRTETGGRTRKVAVDAASETAPETPLDTLPWSDHVKIWGTVEGLAENIAVFPTVFWEPQDTASLRDLIRTTPLVKDTTVLEIGTGTGLVALCCLQAGARKVVATDINPVAVANAKYNARLLGLDERLEVRLVSETDPGAYAVVDGTERFDLIVSNPPWEDATPDTFGEYALYDADFALIRSILAGLRDHLNQDGKALLAYGCVAAIKTILELGDEFDLAVEILDDRDLDSLPEVFLPGMLLSVSRRDGANSSSK